MFLFNNSIVPNKVHIGWHFSSNKYAYRDAYSALKSSIKCSLDVHKIEMLQDLVLICLFHEGSIYCIFVLPESKLLL